MGCDLTESSGHPLQVAALDVTPVGEEQLPLRRIALSHLRTPLVRALGCYQAVQPPSTDSVVALTMPASSLAR